jgi:hypothetical protein
MNIPKPVTFLQRASAEGAAQTQCRRHRMTRALLYPAAIFSIVFAAEAAAQSPAPPSPPAVDLPPITRDGAVQRADSLFLQLDLNHDGIVARGEAMQATTHLKAERKATGRDVAPGIGGHTARFMLRRFAGAESINREQFEEAMLAYFDEMDLDRDGILSTAERERVRGTKRSGQ